MEKNSKLNNIVIAIDGTSASGKTTLTTKLAHYYNWPYLLTGNLYRALAFKLINETNDTPKESLISRLVSNITHEDLTSTNLNGSKISEYTSNLAKNETIRKILTKFQRQWIESKPISILEGRDIGTIICPHATVKLFLTASPEVRAKRRWEELQNKEPNITYDDILKNLIHRDKQDSQRKNAPLKKAQDAILIDSSNKTIENIFALSIKIIEKKIDKSKYKV